MAGRQIEAQVAVIGAGVAGLSAARRLAEAGVSVVVFDQARRPGGRLATKKHHDRQFDFGAQYMKPHSRRSAVLFSDWRKVGIISPWRANALELPQRKKVDTTSWHVAVPSMNSLAEYLAKDLEIHCRFRALDVSGEKGKWSIIGQRNQSAGPFEAVFLTTQASQTIKLLAPYEESFPNLSEVESRPCLATMVEFDDEVMVDYEAAFVGGGPLAWVCLDSSKPERKSKECWVLHATDDWSKVHLDEPPEQVASQMLSAFAPLSPVELPPVLFCRAHRWRFAFGTTASNSTHRFSKELGLGVAGDWCNTPNIDGAYWSGCDLAEVYLDSTSKL
jgi:predicted NAD/FAD-dependent oxidoreductase